MNPDYLKLADAIADDIASGRLEPSARLPTQRAFAYEKGIAVSTAARVYGELMRRGLVTGEVGRGTFVARQRATPLEPERIDGRIELERNFPVLPGQAAAIAKSLAGLFQPAGLDAALRPVTARQLALAADTAASFLKKGPWAPAPESFTFTGSGRQSIAAAISALVPVGGRLGVEAITYPMVKTIAARLGVMLVPLAVDDEGIEAEALARAHKTTPLTAIYMQPYLQNPLGVCMSPARRQSILRFATEQGLTIIEDHVYGFLTDDPPLAAWAPERCIVIDSLAKRVAPGVALGFLSAAPSLRERFAATVRGGTWQASTFGIAAGTQLMADGTAAALTEAKREDAAARQRLAREILGGFEMKTDPRSYHLWLLLPDAWRSETLVAAAGRRNITLTPSSAFAVMPGYAPDAVRLALSTPPLDVLRNALTAIACLLRSSPDEAESTE